MILGTSGHRALGEASFPKLAYNAIYEKTKSIIQELSPSRMITGMAVGWDTLVADLCVEMNIPFICALPFTGQEAYWSVYDKNHYNDLLAKAEKIEIINRSGWANWKYQTRNVWIVDHSDKMLFCYDGGNSSGTKNCYDYAIKSSKEIIRINPLDYRK